MSDKPMVITDNDIFAMHADTPVCPHCHKQRIDGPMGFYKLHVTCECGKTYTVTRRRGGTSMKYQWKIEERVAK